MSSEEFYARLRIMMGNRNVPKHWLVAGTGMFTTFKPIQPKPDLQIKHCGDIPKDCYGVDDRCHLTPTQFMVFHTPDNASARFYCDDCFHQVHHHYFPDGEPSEPM